MSALARDLIARTGLWAVSNPEDVALLYLAARYAPIRVMKIGIETGRYYGRISGPTVQWGANISRIVIGARGVQLVGAVGTTAVYGAAVGVGAILGAAAGTAISTTIWGREGNQLANEFYTGEVDNWYDYLPAYNAYKIVSHYVK